jgi:hypothetical protein
MRIRIRDLDDPGSGMEKFGSGIRHKHPGSATLIKKKERKMERRLIKEKERKMERKKN